MIRLDDGVSLQQPIQLLFVVSIEPDRPRLINPRNLVIVGEGAQLDLIESHLFLSPGGSLTNLVNQIVVGKGAKLRHDRLQMGRADGTHHRQDPL